MENIQTLIAGMKARRTGVVTNHEGAPAYIRSLPEQVLQVLTTGTLGNTFYVSGAQLAREAVAVLLQARDEMPEFLARALVYARQQGFRKLMPVLGLTVLSGGRGKTRALFESVFDSVVLIPDDLRAFALLSKSGVIPGRQGLGGVAAAAVRRWVERISEYHAVKYGSTASQDMTLKDIVCLTHPRGSVPAASERLGWLVRGRKALGDDSALNPMIQAFELLKRTTTENEQVDLIRKGLPYEVVIPSLAKTTPAIWEQLLYNAPYMNLLRNLQTFTRHGVFAQEANVRYVVERLTDAAAIKRARVLPFRFYTAWQQYRCGDNPDSRLADALRAALEVSFCNMPSLGKLQVCIGTDVSWSMNSCVSEKSATRYIDVAGVFTGALLKRCEDRVIPLPFDTGVHPDCGLSARDDILVTADKIAQFCGGGTAVGAPVEYLLDRQIPVDAFIGITDNVDWAYGGGYSCRGSFLDLWRSYREQVAPQAQAFLVTIAPYGELVAPSDEPGVHFIYGWSAEVLRYIALQLESGGSQVRTVSEMALKHIGEPGTHDESATDAQTETEDS